MLKRFMCGQLGCQGVTVEEQDKVIRYTSYRCPRCGTECGCEGTLAYHRCTDEQILDKLDEIIRLLNRPVVTHNLYPTPTLQGHDCFQCGQWISPGFFHYCCQPTTACPPSR